MDIEEPIVTFYSLAPALHAPMRGDRAVAGTIPTRAYRYCEALCSASSFGWYVFPPIDFTLEFDGTDVIWTHPGADAWYPLKNGATLPGFQEYFDANAPEDLRGQAPRFMTQFPEPGIVQVWSGLFAHTRSRWSLLVRPPANFARTQRYEQFEGLIEADEYFTPVFVNLRLTGTDYPIEFLKDFPLAQVQPVHRDAYSDSAMRSMQNVVQLREFDWRRYRQGIVERGTGPHRRKGEYAAMVRKRAD